MPLHDYQCSFCGAFQIDVYEPRRDAEPPMCPEGCTLAFTHHTPESIALSPAGTPISMSTMEKLWSSGSASSPFKEISVEIGGKTVVCKSMRDINRVENSTTDAWLRGEPGAQPILFRNFSQDRSNRDKSVVEQHFSDRVRHQRSGDPRDRPENFSKASGRRKIDIRQIRGSERERIIREEGLDE
jgi:hypothetical protein